MISTSDIHFKEEFFHSSGPGGQNVNKVATGVRIRYFLSAADLPSDVRRRLRKMAGRKITKDGTLIVESTRYRTRERNRRDAKRKLLELLQRSWERPRIRKDTKPPRWVARKRLDSKKRRSQTKSLRGRVRGENRH